MGDRITDIAGRHSVDPAVLSIAWLLDRPHIAAVVVGTSFADKLARLCQAGEISLGNELRAALDETSAPAILAEAPTSSPLA